MALELNRDNYESETSSVKGPMMVDFWGPQCRPCLALMPAVDELEKAYEGKLKVAKVDVTKNRMLCAKLRIMSVPTFIFQKEGVENNRLTGDDITRADLQKVIDAIVE